MVRSIFKHLFYVHYYIAGILFIAASAKAEFQPIGNVTSTQVFQSAVEFDLSSGAKVRIDLMDNTLVRVRINPTGTLSTRNSIAIAPNLSFNAPLDSIYDTGPVVWLLTSKMMVAVIKEPFRVIALHDDGALLSADLESSVLFDDTTGLIVNRKYSPPNEAILGLGMRGGNVNRRGRTITMRNTDSAGYTEFTDPLYQSYPFFYGILDNKAYGLFLDSPAYPFFDVADSEPGVLSFGAHMGELNYYLIAGPDPQDVANTYSRLTGFNQLPPLWSLGHHHSRYGWQSEDEIKNIAEQLREKDFPTDTLWFDIDYMDEFQKFTWDPVDFPNPTQMHADLLQDGFKSIYINEPLVRTDDALWPFLDASEYFVKNFEGESHVNQIWFGNVSFLDFTKTDVQNWYKPQLGTFMSTGISGLWNDLNEPANNFMPDAMFNFDGDIRGQTESRNLYANYVNRTAYESQLALRPNIRPWNFSRGGYSGIQRYAHTWGGDAWSGYESIRVSIQMSISMGISGQNQFGHDMGGFLESPDAELFTRWMEFSLFTPLFRNHSANITAPREPWLFGEPHTSRLRDLVKWRYRLLPYIYTLFEEAHRTGRPVLMPTFFFHEEDPITYNQDTEFLFGPNLLVAPVFTENTASRTLYLPENSEWVYFYTDQVFQGGQYVTVPAPLGQPPLFVRKGGIIPTGEVGKSTDDPNKGEDLTVDFYPTEYSQYTLYEDDGKTFDYQQGEYLRTHFSLQQSIDSLQLTVNRLDGDYLPQQRALLLRVHLQENKPSQVQLNSASLPEYPSEEDLKAVASGWFYDEINGILSIKSPDAPLLLFETTP
ncbi:TIM-barrel domain-containing protein [Glaciecola sp. 1036]|uniref:glycoside hydrolase family 31 protein n=1 Tax=Alteromonadaceae TaxID=72275 RepID=UPI003D00DA6B